MGFIEKEFDNQSNNPKQRYRLTLLGIQYRNTLLPNKA